MGHINAIINLGEYDRKTDTYEILLPLNLPCIYLSDYFAIAKHIRKRVPYRNINFVFQQDTYSDVIVDIVPNETWMIYDGVIVDAVSNETWMICDDGHSCYTITYIL